ncbi:hypothetical protein KCP75_15610 [Salmonella enterica subsp. enterica]|nr:hypothetical protein KCP75_15610 [Salmonella enterica subsp. enterica]
MMDRYAAALKAATGVDALTHAIGLYVPGPHGRRMPYISKPLRLLLARYGAVAEEKRG